MWNELMDFAASRPTHAISDAFRPATAVAAGVAVVGFVASDPVVLLSGILTAFGTAVFPKLIDWYRDSRAAKREADLADLKAHAEAIEEEVRRRVELEGQCNQLKAETAANRHKIKDLEQQIVFMKAAQAKTDDKVKILTTPDPDAHP